MVLANLPDFRPLRASVRCMSDRPGPRTSSPGIPGGSFSDAGHIPVMAAEIIADMPLRPGATVVDGTLGLGGHAQMFIDAIRPGGTLVGMEWDETMLEIARKRLGDPAGVRLVLVHDDFRNMSATLERLETRADGILLDLGLNSAQIDDPARGFSFKADAQLDMRMDRSSREPASALLNRMTTGQIEAMLIENADERWARKIAQVIVERRKTKPLRTTGDLAECVLQAIPPKFREERIHPATRTFQAVRIMVNGELEGLEQALIDAALCLAAGGVLAVLSYHSKEDRIAKSVFKELSKEGFEDLHRKPLTPSQAEVDANPRSRSAKLRSLRRSAPIKGAK